MAWSSVKLFAIAASAGLLLAAGASAQNTVATPASVTPLPAAAPPPVAPALATPTAPAAATAASTAVPAPAEEAAAPSVAAPTVRTAAANVAEDDTPDVPTPPLKRPRFTAAVLQATDKITAETLRFEAKVGESVRYKGLIVTLRACETHAPDEEIADSVANIEVLSQPQGVAGGQPAPTRSVFHGWMFASSPSIHAFEHPLYDLWVIACRTNAPVTPIAGPPAPAPKPRKAPVVKPAAPKAAADPDPAAEASKA